MKSADSRSSRPATASRLAALPAVAALGLSLGLGLGGAACAPPVKAPETPGAPSEWVSDTGATDMRKVTALVRVAPPKELKSQMERVAARLSDADVGDFLRAHVGGSFGSGFLVVHRDASGVRPFVVTNRHVVAGAQEAEITFGDGTTYKDCEIVLVSTTADLAVVALPDAALRTYGAGLRPATGPVTERLGVVATGFPGINGKPSFQITDGKISNAHFTQPESGRKEELFQHTAPIDPGSSGGPLTNEAGELVGANVALLRGRASMFFAVPARDVVDTVRHAHALYVDKARAAWMTKSLTDACTTFAAELASHGGELPRVASFVSNQLVADEGFLSYSFVSSRPTIGPVVRRAFYESPIDAMRASVLLRTAIRAGSAGGATGACTGIHPSDAPLVTQDKPVRLAMKMGSGSDMELRWRFEQGAWRVVGGDLMNVAAILEQEDRESRAAAAAVTAKGARGVRKPAGKKK